MHPMVLHYKEAEESTAVKTFVGVSSVTAHSAPTTFAFIKAMMPYIKETVPNLRKIHFITDSPSSQYRNKTICALIAKFESLFDVQATWTWLEAGHGKGPCDGAGGGIKKKADNLVKSDEMITNASQFAEVLQRSNTAVNILEVTPNEVEQRRQEIEAWDILPVQGIAAAHAAVPIDGFLHLRVTSCFEPCCMNMGIFRATCEGWSKTIFPAAPSLEVST